MREVRAGAVAMGWAAVVAAMGCGGSAADPVTLDAAPAPAPVPDGPSPTKGMPPPPPRTMVTIKAFASSPQPFTGPLANAQLVAILPGEGFDWVALTGTNGIYQAEVLYTRYAVAVGCAGELQSTVRIYYQSISDTKELHVEGCPPPATRTARLSVELTGVPNTQSTEVWVGGTPGGGIGGAVVDVDAPLGLVDLLAFSYVRGSAPKVPVKMFRVPGTLDLQAPQPFTIALDTLGLPVETHQLRLINLDANETASVHSSYATPHSEVQWPVVNTDFGHSATGTWGTLDERMRASDDLSNLTVTSTRTVPDGRTYERQVRHALKTPLDVTLALPAGIEVAAPALDRTGVPHATWTIPIAPATQLEVEYVGALSTSGMTADHNVTSRSLEIHVRPGWAQGAPSTTIETPDLTHLTGWTANMALEAGAVSWSLTRGDRNMPVETPLVDGRLILNSIVSGTLAP